MKDFLKNHALSIVMIALFLLCLGGQSVAGWLHQNEEIQRGSSQSKKPDGEEEEQPVTPKSPWPARVGGLALKLYRHSLSLTFLLLFAGTFLLHAISGRALYNEEALQHGDAPISLIAFIGSSEFWFQSLQNWQSEFLAVAALVLLSIVLREHGSPESKPVQAPHAQTGT
jgi:hypothetical protein